jgi:hypothetical protein
MKYTSDEIQSAGAEVPVDEVVAQALPAGLVGSAMAYTPLQVHFLARLQRLSDARHEMGMTNDEDPFMKRLVDRVRGRVLGVYGIVWGIQPLSGTQAAFLSQFFGVAVAVALGGVAIITMAVVAAAVNPSLRQLRTDPPTQE